MSAGLCAAGVCRPNPRLTTTAASSYTSESASLTSSVTTETTTIASGLTTEETITVTESASSIETSATESETSIESSITESGTSIEATVTTSAAPIESSVIESTTAAESSTTVPDATSTTEEATTTTNPPIETVEVLQNRGFEDATLSPWQNAGEAEAGRSNENCREGSHCAVFSSPSDAIELAICQRVEILQGFEYTFTAYVRQDCRIEDSGAVNSGWKEMTAALTYHQYRTTFQYTGPSIDSTDLCIWMARSEGEVWDFYIDSTSLKRGKPIPIPDEMD
ncbi:hypothetical protein IL306_011369 [Fusarium sp. DS 682]|nr:hypothetical protein IL306_011369 [Fusarium sp. DS 682]